MASEAPLSIRSFDLCDDGLEAVVFVSSPEVMRTSAFPGLAEELLARYPGLRRHPCEARGIVAELADTETPHLLEHLALELLALDGLPRLELRGRTAWDFATDGRGVFRVRLCGAPAAECRAALTDALEVLGPLLG